MTEKLIEEVYKRWGNSWGFPTESMKEKIIAFGKMLLEAKDKPTHGTSKGTPIKKAKIELLDEPISATFTPITTDNTTIIEEETITEDSDEEN